MFVLLSDSLLGPAAACTSGNEGARKDSLYKDARDNDTVVVEIIACVFHDWPSSWFWMKITFGCSILSITTASYTDDISQHVFITYSVIRLLCFVAPFVISSGYQLFIPFHLPQLLFRVLKTCYIPINFLLLTFRAAFRYIFNWGGVHASWHWYSFVYWLFVSLHLPQLLAIPWRALRHTATPYIKSQRLYCGLRGTNTMKGAP